MITINGNTQINKKEVSAYLQQQLNELAPHIDPASPVELKLTEIDEGFEVELTADHSSGVIQTLGWNQNLFGAIRSAKEGLLDYFVEVEAELNPHKRDERIDQITRHGHLYLH